jgi:hypothetical protein
MTITEIDFPTDSSYEAVTAFYRRKDPFFDAYNSVIEENNQHVGPITEPSTGGVTTYQAAQIALARVGRPTDDPMTIRHAEAYISHLREEIKQAADRVVPTITSALLDLWFPWSGAIPDVEAWNAMPDDEQWQWAAELVDHHLVDEALVDAVKLAMPVLIEHAIAESQRRKLAAVKDQEDER